MDQIPPTAVPAAPASTRDTVGDVAVVLGDALGLLRHVNASTIGVLAVFDLNDRGEVARAREVAAELQATALSLQREIDEAVERLILALRRFAGEMDG